MFRPKCQKKDRMYYLAFKMALEQYQFKVYSPAHSVALYQHNLEKKIIIRSHCFMKKVSDIYNSIEPKHITNYGTAQYYYKTFQNHIKNYDGEGDFEPFTYEKIDFNRDISVCSFNNFLD